MRSTWLETAVDSGDVDDSADRCQTGWDRIVVQFSSKSVQRILASDHKTAAVLEVPPIENFLQDLPIVGRVGSHTEVVQDENIGFNQPVQNRLFILRLSHP